MCSQKNKCDIHYIYVDRMIYSHEPFFKKEPESQWKKHHNQGYQKKYKRDQMVCLGAYPSTHGPYFVCFICFYVSDQSKQGRIANARRCYIFNGRRYLCNGFSHKLVIWLRLIGGMEKKTQIHRENGPLSSVGQHGGCRCPGAK